MTLKFPRPEKRKESLLPTQPRKSDVFHGFLGLDNERLFAGHRKSLRKN